MRIAEFEKSMPSDAAKTHLRHAITLLENAKAHDPRKPFPKGVSDETMSCATYYIDQVVCRLPDHDPDDIGTGLQDALLADLKEIFVDRCLSLRAPSPSPSPSPPPQPEGLASEVGVLHGVHMGGAPVQREDDALIRAKENLVHAVRALFTHVQCDDGFVPVPMEAGTGLTQSRPDHASPPLGSDGARLLWRRDAWQQAMVAMAMFTDVAIDAMIAGEMNEPSARSGTAVLSMKEALRDCARICIREEMKQRFGLTDAMLDAHESVAGEGRTSFASGNTGPADGGHASWERALTEAIASRHAQADRERDLRCGLRCAVPGFQEDMRAFFQYWGVDRFYDDFSRHWIAYVESAYSKTPAGQCIADTYFVLLLTNVIAVDMYASPVVPSIDMAAFVLALRDKLQHHFDGISVARVQPASVLDASAPHARVLAKMNADIAVLVNVLGGLASVYTDRLAMAAYKEHPTGVGSVHATIGVAQLCGVVYPRLVRQFVEASLLRCEDLADGCDAATLFTEAMALCDRLTEAKFRSVIVAATAGMRKRCFEPTTELIPCREAIKALARVLTPEEFSTLSGSESSLMTGGVWTLAQGESLVHFRAVIGDPCVARLLEELIDGASIDDAVIDARLRAAPPTMVIAIALPCIMTHGMDRDLRSLAQDTKAARAELDRQDQASTLTAAIEREATSDIVLTPGEQQAIKSAVGYAKKSLPAQFKLFEMMCRKLPYAGLLALQQQMNAMDASAPLGDRLEFLAHVGRSIKDREMQIAQQLHAAGATLAATESPHSPS